MHHPFPLPHGFPVLSGQILYVKFGTKEAYSKKIYGEDFDPDLTSWDKFPGGVVEGWPLRYVYERLHAEVQPYMVEASVNRPMMNWMCSEYDLVFNSAPAALFCDMTCGEPTVRTEKVWIVNGPPDAKHPNSRYDGLIVYEGTSAVPFYRYSYLEGRESWEYPHWHDPGDPRAKLINKPLSIDRPPMHGKIVPIGRYGKWKKGELVDTVYDEVSNVLAGYKVVARGR